MYIVQFAYSQNDSLKIDFVEADPIWVYQVVDTNFYISSSNPNITKYNASYPFQILRRNDDLFLYSKGIAANGDSYGYMLEKMNIQNGELIWSFYNTFYNNDSCQEVYNSILFDNDLNIELLGAKRASIPPSNPDLFTMWDLGFDGSYLSIRSHDFSNGDLLKLIEGSDSLEFHGTLIQQFQSKNEQFWIMPNAIIDTNTPNLIQHGFEFYNVENDLTISQNSPFDTVLYQTDDELTPMSIESHMPLLQIDSSIFVGIVFQDRYDPAIFKSQIIWMEVSHDNKVNVLKRLNIEDIIPWTFQTLVFSRFQTNNDQIYFNHIYFNDVYQKYMAYMLWLDKEGHVKNMISEPIYDNHIYQFLRVIHANNENSICMGLPSKTGRNGVDFIRIKANSDSLEYISSLTSVKNDESFTNNMTIYQLFDDGKFILGSQTSRTNTEIEKSWSTYYCFQAEDLKIDFIDEQNSVVLNDWKIFPNPVSNELYLNLGELDGQSFEILIINENGLIIKRKISDSSKIRSINVRDIKSGKYFVVIKNSGNTLFKTKKILIIHNE